MGPEMGPFEPHTAKWAQTCRRTTHAHRTHHMTLAQRTPGKYETNQPYAQGRAQKLQILANQAQNQPKWSLTPIPSPKAAPHSCNHMAVGQKNPQLCQLYTLTWVFGLSTPVGTLCAFAVRIPRGAFSPCAGRNLGMVIFERSGGSMQIIICRFE